MSKVSIYLWIALIALALIFSAKDGLHQSNSAAFSRAEATRQIQAIAETEKIALTTHAKKRMRQRGLSFADVAETLKRGEVWEDARLGDKGEWLYKMNYQPTDGTRRIEVVVAIEDKALRVITAMRQGEDQ